MQIFVSFNCNCNYFYIFTEYRTETSNPSATRAFTSSRLHTKYINVWNECMKRVSEKIPKLNKYSMKIIKWVKTGNCNNKTNILSCLNN